MLCSEAFPILQAKGITELYHANTVATSRSLLILGGLVSRARVENEGLPQTNQYTDFGDKKFGVWNDIFTDSVDIHARVRDKNQYGPVLFVLDTRLLLDLGADVEAHFTKFNPADWIQGQTYEDRYFPTAADLAGGLVRGTFDHMITFRTPGGLIPFGQRLQRIILDEPRMNWTSGVPVFQTAIQSLQAAAEAKGIAVEVSQRHCAGDCRCLTYYHGNPHVIQKYFGLP